MGSASVGLEQGKGGERVESTVDAPGTSPSDVRLAVPTDDSPAPAAEGAGVSPDPDQPVVRIRGLSKVYEPTPRWMRMLVRTIITQPIVALEGVDLEIEAGGICAVVGPNGAGKTTMFRILVGLTTPTSGAAAVAGLDVQRQSTQVRRQVGWMPSEDRSLFMRTTCWENLHFHGRLHGIKGEGLARRIRESLEQVRLGDYARTQVFGLSAGMRARLQLARALMTRPRLLILDEPTAAVDPVGAHELLELITQLVAEHRMAALISSHRLEEIEALHSNVILLDRGRVRFQGDLDTLRARWDQPQIELEFASPDDARAGAEVLTTLAKVERTSPTTVVCSPHEGVALGEMLERLGPATSRVVRIRELPLPLRDVLAKLYRTSPIPILETARETAGETRS